MHITKQDNINTNTQKREITTKPNQINSVDRTIISI
jgi:hypothetical protein